MVSTLVKMMAILLFINIFMYVGVNLAITAEGEEWEQDSTFFLEGDLLQKLIGTGLEDSIRSAKENLTDYDINVNQSELISFPGTEGSSEFGQVGFGFKDLPGMFIDFAKLLFNVAMSPIILFTTFRLPWFFLALLGIPYLLIMVVVVMLVIRGVSG